MFSSSILSLISTLFYRQRGFHNLSVAMLLCFMFAIPLQSAQPVKRNGYDDNGYPLLNELKTSLDALKHEVKNQDAELHMLEERTSNQAETIESLRKQVQDATQVNKDLVRTNTTSVEGRMASLEAVNKGFIADLQQLKTHANETAAVLAQYKQKLGELDKALNLHSQNMENLQSAMRALTDILQVKEGVVSGCEGSGNTYRIKSGDNLEKIARQHNTTVKAIRELNQMTTDRIVVGQTIQIP